MWRVLVVVGLLVGVSAMDFEPAKVRLLDYSPVYGNGLQNFLFRGNEPKVPNLVGDFLVRVNCA
jgi:hypothetical protein